MVSPNDATYLWIAYVQPDARSAVPARRWSTRPRLGALAGPRPLHGGLVHDEHARRPLLGRPRL